MWRKYSKLTLDFPFIAMSRQFFYSWTKKKCDFNIHLCLKIIRSQNLVQFTWSSIIVPNNSRLPLRSHWILKESKQNQTNHRNILRGYLKFYAYVPMLLYNIEQRKTYCVFLNKCRLNSQTFCNTSRAQHLFYACSFRILRKWHERDESLHPSIWRRTKIWKYDGVS